MRVYKSLGGIIVSGNRFQETGYEIALSSLGFSSVSIQYLLFLLAAFTRGGLSWHHLLHSEWRHPRLNGPQPFLNHIHVYHWSCKIIKGFNLIILIVNSFFFS